MVKMASCPTKEDLIRLNHGDLPGDQLESVCDHVEICEKCQLILGQLDEPPNNIGKQLAKISQADLENARIAIEEEMLQDRATTIWGQLAPSQQKDHDSTLDVPCNLRQYEVLKLIGYGGMGEVYEGRHSNLKRPVALKVIQGIRQDDPIAYEHFLREMETAGQLEHPNLVRAYDAWEHDGCLFLAQELLDGDSLQELASQGLIRTPEEIIDAVLGTSRALEQLHAKGFVHRDVKPGNIMRLTDSTIKLIDYGLAIAAESGKSAARIGAGTIGYMSPEQAHGSGPIDYRSDIYSTGRVLKYLLSKLSSDTNGPKREYLIKRLSKLANRLTEKYPQQRPKNIYSVVVELEQLQQSVKSQEKNAGSPAPSSGSESSRHKRRRSGNSTKSELKRAAAPEPQIAPQSLKKRVSPWLYLLVLVLGMGSFGAFQLIFKTDRQATVLVENHQPGDVIQITSEDGKVRSVELSDQAKFIVAPGSYKLSLAGPGERQLTPGNITVTGRDELKVRIDEVSDPTGGADKPMDSIKPLAESKPKTLAEIVAESDDADFVPLFNGKDLDGWELDRRLWRVENGILLGKKRPRSGPDTFAATENEFDDFILKLKFILNSGDSGIQFGGHLLSGLNTMTGSHLNISYERNMEEIGQLYVNKELFSVPTVPKRRELANEINVTGWNDCIIAAKGNRVWATINGIVVVDLEYNDRNRGSIGLQLHSSGADIAFKDILIKKIE
jgi:serine/threonine-protein kinase